MANKDLDDFAIVTSFEDHEKQRKHLVELETEIKNLKKERVSLFEEEVTLNADKEELKQLLERSKRDLQFTKKKADADLDTLKQKHETMRKQYEELKFAYDDLEKKHMAMKGKAIETGTIVKLHHVNNRYYLCLNTFSMMDYEQQTRMQDILHEKLKITIDANIKISHCNTCRLVCAKLYATDMYDVKMETNPNGSMCELSYFLLK